MAEIAVEETRLRQILDELVQKHLRLTLDDMEEVRRSPAASIVRLEMRFDALEKNMATKADVANLRSELNERIGGVETTLGERIGRVETTLGERIAKLETGQKLIYAFLLTILGMLVKLVFFS
ncbi:MAG: hypothetical protein ACE5I1_01650 [bacterium]